MMETGRSERKFSVLNTISEVCFERQWLHNVLYVDVFFRNSEERRDRTENRPDIQNH